MDKNLHKKKILFLITKSNWGGAQRYVFDLATSLDPEKYEVVVASGAEGILTTKLNEAGIRTCTIPGLTRDISLLKELRATFALARIIRTEAPDILHVNSSKAGGLGALLGRIFFIPRVIFTAHGWAFNEDRPAWQKYILKSIQYVTVLLSHHTIAVSTATRAQMNWPFAQQKMTVVHPGRTMHEVKKREDARGILETKVHGSAANLSEYHTDLWVGTIAELHPVKQLHRAIDSIAALTHTIPNVRYIIIGDGQLATSLQQQVRDLGVEKHIFFTGAITEAARFLSAFDVFVLPSSSEAFGYVLLEAGLAHVPVVATNVGGIPDIITDEKTGLLVPPLDTPKLTDALKRLLNDANLRNTLAGAHLVQAQEYTVEKMRDETIAVYLR